MNRLLKQINYYKTDSVELTDIGIDSIISFLNEKGAVHLHEAWFLDLQFDELKVEGETIILLQETWMDPVLMGPKKLLSKLEKEIKRFVQKK